tara:strand:- start:578 stop:859 length:282 start_codon:yes stop_codon:yes gene_type:complete
MAQIVDRDFEYEFDFASIQGTVTLDISGTCSKVVCIKLESDEDALTYLRDAIMQRVDEDEDYDARTLQDEEREWADSQKAEAKVEDYLREDEC